MTYLRVLRRNKLYDGDYGVPPPLVDDRPYPDLVAYMVGSLNALAGDLRRLEKDARDENALCKRIASRTGVAADVVAAVLQEFLTI